MPLSTGTTNASREKNIETELEAHPDMDPKQAVAIGYSKQRENRAAKDAINRLYPHVKGLRDCLAKIAKVVQP